MLLSTNDSPHIVVYFK